MFEVYLQMQNQMLCLKRKGKVVTANTRGGVTRKQHTSLGERSRRFSRNPWLARSIPAPDMKSRSRKT